MDLTIPSTFQVIFSSFAVVFTTPSFENFVTLATGWMLSTGRHTISGVLRSGSAPGRNKHFSSLYRFFSRAVWDTDVLGEVLFHLLLPLSGKQVLAAVDDTLCRRSGPHFWGAGMHHDPLRSTYGRGTSASRWFAMAFGHNWVVLAVWVPLPWARMRGVAVPVLWRLYRSKKRCPASQYRKRTELAREMIDVVAGWLPEDRRLTVVGDGEYACKTVLRHLPEGVDFTGPMVMDAAFYDVPRTQPRRGRRLKGKRLPSPQKLARMKSVRWETITPAIYGREVPVMVKELVGMWYGVTHTRLVRMVVTRDPAGRIEDRAYFTTDPDLTAEEILGGFSRRWSLEVTFRDAKQNLGLEDPQNGWWRRRKRIRRRRKKPGPQPKGRHGEKAVRHTVPFTFCVYGLVIIWYFRHGNVRQDVERVRKLSPWYRHKKEPSFADMLAAVRRELWKARIMAYPSLRRVGYNIRRLIPEWLAAA